MKKISTFTVTLFLIFFASQKIFADTHYVSLSGGNVSPYISWENAATTIQAAVDVALPGEVVLVANGVYDAGGKITPGYELSNRVVITKDITLRSVNGPESAIILGNEAVGGRTGIGAVRCVFMNAGKLYGFTMSNGFTITTGDSGYDQSGSGIWLSNGCVVTNCIINGNTANNDGGGVCFLFGGSISDCSISGNNASVGYGGGVCFWSGGSVSNCSINGNSTDVSGGGVYCESGGSVFDCSISENRANICGGGVYFWTGGSISDCSIIGNSATFDGGGVNCNSGGSVSNCIISENNADECGGGVHCYRDGSIFDCSIKGNSAGGQGGGVYFWSGGSVSYCSISENSATCHGGGICFWSGGSVSYCSISENSAACHGGGICFWSGGSLTNCLITGLNTATYGGGAYLFQGGSIISSTIAGNNASAFGGGIVCSNGGTIVNTIIYDNQAASGNVNWLNYGNGANVSYSCTTPINNLPGGNGCIQDNPEFIVPGSDYHLSGVSPCVDSGIILEWMTGATDLDGNPRIHNCKVDIGAYEYLSEKIPVTTPNWKLKNKKKKSALKGKPIDPLLVQYLTNGYGIGIWNLATDCNIDGPRQLVSKNKKKTVWVYKDKTNKHAKIIYKEKYDNKKNTYKTKLKYILQEQIPKSNLVYIAPL